MLTCEGLTKSFDKPLFQDLAINLGPGQITVSYTHLRAHETR